jgi:hypothetical protein
MASPMPSSDVNAANAVERVKECHQYITVQQWSQFRFLYPKLAAFQETLKPKHGDEAEDEFSTTWNTLRFTAVDSIMKNLENARKFEDFLDWMQRLSEIVTDPRSLWNILHTEVQASLKITQAQSDELASQFFSPEKVFEFGLDSFLGCSLCDFSHVTEDGDLIDMFYSTVGFLRSCHFPDKFEIKQSGFHDFTAKLLTTFSSRPSFDGNAFVWLVEAIREHFRLSAATFKSICERVLIEFSKRQVAGDPILYFEQVIAISTSPFLQAIPALKDTVNAVFQNVVQAEQAFAHLYIFGGCINSVWTTKRAADSPSEPLRAWDLFISRLIGRCRPLKALASKVIALVIDDSMWYFMGYYGEVQPSKERAANLRMDIFAIIDLCVKYYPDKMPSEFLKKVWYLLYIAAVSGASDAEVGDVKHADCAEKDQPYLGLEHTDREFKDYKVALARLSKKFESEFDVFPTMVSFIRTNYA